MFFKRNQYTVKKVDLLLVAFDNQFGCIAGTVAYVKRHDVHVACNPPIRTLIFYIR